MLDGVSLPEVDQDHAGRKAQSVQDGRIDVDWTTRATVNLGRGRVKSTIGVPGTGMSYSKSTSKNTNTRNAAAVRQQTARALQPKIPKDDKRVLDAISSANIAELDEISRRGKSEHALPAGMLAGLIANATNPAWA